MGVAGETIRMVKRGSFWHPEKIEKELEAEQADSEQGQEERSESQEAQGERAEGSTAVGGGPRVELDPTP